MAKSFSGKMFLFPSESDTAYVRITPKKPLNLQAFMLCMRVATELNSQRETILFAYRTQQVDELNVWQENGTLSLYLRSSGDGALFALPPLSAFPTHLCTTWDSSTGATAFWVNGHCSLLKIYRRGHKVVSGGAIILGQDPDSYVGKFDIKQSSVGEISDIQMWDSVLSAGQIELLYNKQNEAPIGNVLDWNSLQYQIFGNVVQVSD
ncbi:C-reactive protein-like [Neoarius graeffei]|uniref:C-reactive protein-like n=1 Tax=Neoarius graeffei TaxID=443677 RepID=UPI00298BDBCE|nr:C-reactive protein-like [Neoarius graeffei]